MSNPEADAVKVKPDEEEFGWRRLGLVLVGWQALALVLTGTSVFSQLLADAGFNGPLLQNLPNYLLCSCFSLVLLGRKKRIHLAWWKYALLAVADVEGNFFVVLAYQYTDIASATLLDCFTIPMVLVLSCVVLKTRYAKQHFLGVVICIAGLVMLVVSDLIGGRYPIGVAKNMPLGDLLVLIGAGFYAISNVGQEYVVKNFDFVEFLGMVGLFGSMVTAVQMVILERAAIVWLIEDAPSEVWGYYAGFVACLFLLYIGVPQLMQISSATMMNISFLTSDFWAVLAALFVFKAKLNVLYFVAFVVIILGVTVYHLAGSTAGPPDEAVLANECSEDDEASQSLSKAFQEEEGDFG